MIRELKELIFGIAGEDALPARVQDHIRRAQDESEILIGWVQLAGVLFFALVYSIAPKTFDADIMFAPVPWALGFYVVFTLIRLYLAHRRRLPHWMIALSVVIDMTVLLVTIWSFHLQYDQPPGLSLKAPTLLYIFILIALRTLRFEARYVLFAGATAIVGWLILLAYAIRNSPNPDVITRDYVHYITSTDILIGGEVDKILSILAVTLVLAVALARARRILVRSMAEQTAARDLSRFFAPDVAARITASETLVRAGQGETRHAAILYLDIRGFTALAHRLPADQVMALLADYQSLMVPVIQRFGGSIDKFLGDGILATFGAVLTTESYAADAMAAAHALLCECDDWNHRRESQGLSPLAMGVGVAVGPVVFGAVGDDTRLEFTVIGDPVNLAAKLEKHCKTEAVRGLTTADAMARARDQGYAEAASHDILPGRPVEGVDETLDLAVIVP